MNSCFYPDYIIIVSTYTHTHTHIYIYIYIYITTSSFVLRTQLEKDLTKFLPWPYCTNHVLPATFHIISISLLSSLFLLYLLFLGHYSTNLLHHDFFLILMVITNNVTFNWFLCDQVCILVTFLISVIKIPASELVSYNYCKLYIYSVINIQKTYCYCK